MIGAAARGALRARVRVLQRKQKGFPTRRADVSGAALALSASDSMTGCAFRGRKPGGRGRLFAAPFATARPGGKGGKALV
jgi:hypothetical protein